ncbi:MAG TPA: hypothetical protein VNJ07_03955 [Chitinophagales bacterium]|nr:hypothetical protein [Chitinophagales bacterium]
MDNREEIEKELSELAPKLSAMAKENPFRVPDYYFQGLPGKVLEKIKSQPVPWTDKLEMWLNSAFMRIFRPRYSVPVSAILLALLIGINFFKTKNSRDDSISRQLASISSEEINDFIIENFDADELEAFEGLPEPVLIIPQDITDEELQNYLDNISDNQTPEEEFL